MICEGYFLVFRGCPSLKTPPKAVIRCENRRGKQTCKITCEGDAKFVGELDGFNTSCGPSTGYTWSHQIENRTIPSCSGENSQD